MQLIVDQKSTALHKSINPLKKKRAKKLNYLINEN